MIENLRVMIRLDFNKKIPILKLRVKRWLISSQILGGGGYVNGGSLLGVATHPSGTSHASTLKSRPMEKWAQKGSLNALTPKLNGGSPKLQKQTPTLEEATMSNDKSRWQSQSYPLIGHLYPQT